jgi:hypothetical protein
MNPRRGLELLLVPRAEPQLVARALAAVPASHPELVVLVLDEAHAQVSVLRFVDGAGMALDVDLRPFAQALSAGGRSAGVARIDAAQDARSWTGWRDGAVEATLGEADELYVPHDEDGLPDLDVEPVPRARAGAGWRRLRSCLDLGMQRLASCRFTPVAHALDAMAAGEEVPVHAFVLRRGGAAVQPPAEVPWRRLPDAG